jgi:hypothetical protein
VWQYSAPIGDRGARAFLFIPPQCERVRGALIALDNLAEKPLLEDLVIREAAGAEDLAIIWIGANSDGKRPFADGFKPEKGDDAVLDGILADLAKRSGYEEIASAPLLPLGHSAGVPFAMDLAYARPERMIAAVDFKSVLPPRAKEAQDRIDGVPLLIVKGQFEEWAKPPALTDREASWHEQRNAALALRKRSENALVGFLLDAGGGHFEAGDEVTQVIAMFVRKAANARLVRDGKNGTEGTNGTDGDLRELARSGLRRLTPSDLGRLTRSGLRRLTPSEGWLTDSGTAIENGDAVIAAYPEFAGDRQKAFWYLDREMAEAVRNYGVKQRGKKPQFVTFAKGDDGGAAPLSGRGIVELPFLPEQDGRTFKLAGRFFDTVPAGLVGQGEPVTGGNGRPRVALVRGPAVQVGPDTFRIQFDNSGFSPRGVDLWVLALHPGDAGHRRAVQAGHVVIPRANTAGRAQRMAFPEIPDQRATTVELKLQATVDSGQRAEYGVLSGPAEISGISGDGLRFSQLPPRSAYPVEVIVLAYQWGRTVEPLVQSAEPVTRTFRIVKAPGPAAFVHPGMLHNRAELDFVKAKVSAGEEPWKTAWDELSKSPYAALTWKPRPTADVVRDLKFWRGAHELGEDALAAYTQALQWAITADPAHARKAAEILNAWSHTMKSITGHDAKLLGGITGYKLCNAAEILRHTGADWPEAEQEQFRQMLKGVYYPLIHDFFPKANGNWDASMIVTTMSIGIFCDDRGIYDRAVDYALHSSGHGALDHYVYPSGQCQESTRDQPHTQLGLGYFGDACETAWKQGQDLWGAYEDRLAIGFEYTARYNLGLDVPAEGKISAEGRGRFRPVYEKVYHHYHDRRGLEMKYTKEVIDKIRPEPPHWDHIPWGTLMFAGLPAGE